VGCRRHDVEAGIKRIAHHVRGNQSAIMADVSHRERANFVGNALECRIVQVARIGTVAAQHHPRTRFTRSRAQFVKIDRAAV
jgi:hypothetical protein